MTLSAGQGGGETVDCFCCCSTTGDKTGELNAVCDAAVGIHSFVAKAVDTGCSRGMAEAETAAREFAGGEICSTGSAAGGWLVGDVGFWTIYGSTAGGEAAMLVASVGGVIRRGGSGPLAIAAIGGVDFACVSLAVTASLELLSGSSRAVPTRFGLLR